MKTIIISGATGQVGTAVIESILKKEGDFRILAGVRKAGDRGLRFAGKRVETVPFDFADPESLGEALSQADQLFLLRPPQLSDVPKYFAPLIEVAQANRLDQIVFLSLQGAERLSFVPHHKIEELILKSGINYTFLRPAYFMQNFTTTLKRDIVEERRIFLPAGDAVFTLVDVKDVGEVAAKVLLAPEQHHNRAYDLTNWEQLTFTQMASILSATLGRDITYSRPILLRFCWDKWRGGTPVSYIMVMVLLHYLPRYQPTPATSEWVARITGRPPRSFAEFVADHVEEFNN